MGINRAQEWVNRGQINYLRTISIEPDCNSSIACAWTNIVMGRAFTCFAGGPGCFSILTKCFFSPKVVGKTEKLLFLNCFVLVYAEINLIGVLPGPITGLQSTKSVVIEKNSCYLVNHRLRLSIQKKGIMRRNARLSNVLIISSTYFATTKLDTYCVGFVSISINLPWSHNP